MTAKRRPGRKPQQIAAGAGHLGIQRGQAPLQFIQQGRFQRIPGHVSIDGLYRGFRRQGEGGCFVRIMGLDYGSKTVGVAVSDPLGITAQGVETICRKDENKLRKTCARIEALIEEYQVTKIVLGLPKHMNNDIGDRAEKSMAFGEMLKRRTGLEVLMWDERLTTVEAERTLIENKVRREDRKKYIDKIAAVFILQGYLDSLAHTPLD